MRHFARILAAWAAFCPLALTARADLADEMIAHVIGRATSDASRARKLVDAARTMGSGDAAAVRLLERALEYAIKSARDAEGFRAGCDALDELQRRRPDGKDRWAEKRIELCRLAYQSSPVEARAVAGVALMKALDAWGGQAVAQRKWAKAVTLLSEAHRVAVATGRRGLYFERKKDAAEHFLKAERTLAALHGGGARGPKDARTRERMLRTLVVDLDDPQRARQHLGPGIGEVWTTYVPLAAGDLKGLPETACRELCDWYFKSLAVKAAPVARERMLRRARLYCRRLLDLHAAKDAVRLGADGRLSEIDRQLRLLDPVGSMLARLRYVDLMKLVDLDFDATEGCWLAAKGTFCSSSKSDGTLRFPVEVTGSYRLSLAVAKLQMAQDVAFTFPVADREVEMTMHEYYASADESPSSRYGPSRTRYRSSSGRVGEKVTWIRLQFEGLSKDRGGSCSKVVHPRYESRKWVPYAVDVAVKVTGERVQMAAMLNRQKWLSWSGSKKSLSSPRGGGGGSIGIRFDKPGVVVSAAKLRPTGGEVKFTRTGADTAWLDEAARGPRPASRCKATASRTARGPDRDSSKPPAVENAFDGDPKTRWSTGAAMRLGDWFAVDLGAETDVKGLILHAGAATDYPRGYRVYISADGRSWGRAIVTGLGTRSPTQIVFPKPVRTRHIRIVQTGRSYRYWWGIAELEVQTAARRPAAPTR